MKKLCLQFHMLPDEVIPILSDVQSKWRLHISMLSGINTFQPIAYNSETLLRLIDNSSVFIAFTIGEPDLSCVNRIEFNHKNKGALYLNLGRQKDGALIESVLSGFIDDDAEALKKVNSLFRKTLKSGGMVSNQDTGISKISPNYLYSVGAMQFQRNGGILKALAGSNVYFPSGAPLN